MAVIAESAIAIITVRPQNSRMALADAGSNASPSSAERPLLWVSLRRDTLTAIILAQTIGNVADPKDQRSEPRPSIPRRERRSCEKTESSLSRDNLAVVTP